MSVTKVHLPELVDPDRRLGRHVHHDERSREFPAERASKIVTVTHQAAGLPLNQGQIGSCTANAACGALNSAPDQHTGDPVRTEHDAVQLYEVETALEGHPWSPANPGKNDIGGSGLEVSKAAKKLGWLTAYHHAFGVQHALEALVLRPVIIGIAWLTSFDHPDPHTGIIEIGAGATVRGGHEVLCDSIDAENQLVGLWNSWGTAYGLGGRFFMTFDTFEQVLANQGDCVVPIR